MVMRKWLMWAAVLVAVSTTAMFIGANVGLLEETDNASRNLHFRDLFTSVESFLGN